MPQMPQNATNATNAMPQKAGSTSLHRHNHHYRLAVQVVPQLIVYGNASGKRV